MNNGFNIIKLYLYTSIILLFITYESIVCLTATDKNEASVSNVLIDEYREESYTFQSGMVAQQLDEPRST